MTIRPRRSVLYMPGSNARALEKAKTLAADGVILDLEDSVAPDAKDTARRQVAEAVLDIVGKPKSLISYVVDRPGHDYRYALDVTRITNLGWEPAVDFRDGLAQTARWYQDHPDWWRPLKSGEYWEYYKRNYKEKS